MTETVPSWGRGGTAAAMTAQNEQTTEQHSTLEQQSPGRLDHPAWCIVWKQGRKGRGRVRSSPAITASQATSVYALCVTARQIWFYDPTVLHRPLIKLDDSQWVTVDNPLGLNSLWFIAYIALYSEFRPIPSRFGELADKIPSKVIKWLALETYS